MTFKTNSKSGMTTNKYRVSLEVMKTKSDSGNSCTTL